MPADEFKLVLKIYSILETKVIKIGMNWSKTALHIGIEFLPDLGFFKLICCYNVTICFFSLKHILYMCL